jgi:hypothetical protein
MVNNVDVVSKRMLADHFIVGFYLFLTAKLLVNFIVSMWLGIQK